MCHSLTPLQALEALVAECELCLDRRNPFRRALANAHTAILQAKKPPLSVLHGTAVVGSLEAGDDDCEVTFKDLFGEPDPSVFNPSVLAVARMPATDGSIARSPSEFVGMVSEGDEKFALYRGVAL